MSAQAEQWIPEMVRNFPPYTAYLLLLSLENTVHMLVCHPANRLQQLVGPFHGEIKTEAKQNYKHQKKKKISNTK